MVVLLEGAVEYTLEHATFHGIEEVVHVVLHGLLAALPARLFRGTATKTRAASLSVQRPGNQAAMPLTATITSLGAHASTACWKPWGK